MNRNRPATMDRTAAIGTLLGLLMLALTATACGDSETPPTGRPAVECTTNAECSNGGVCLVGKCHECGVDSDCAAGMVCRELVCAPGNPDMDAGPDADADVEDEDSGIMDPDLGDVDADDEADVVDLPDVPVVSCGDGCSGLQTCDSVTNSCREPAICIRDQDCFEGRICFENACAFDVEVTQLGGCLRDSQCAAEGSDLFCNLLIHRCQPSGPCQSDAQCPGDLVCEAGVCLPCGVDADCPGGLVCDIVASSTTRNLCIEAGTCGSDEDCHGDRVCSGGACMEPACDGDMFDGGAGNHACRQAVTVTSGTTYAVEICGQTCDWFKIDLAAGDGLVARVLHDVDAGDLDLALRLGPCAEDGGGEVIDRSASLDPAEVVSVPRALNGGSYLLTVCPFIESFDEGTNAYALDVQVVEGGFCLEDVFDLNEPNDLPADAFVINTAAPPVRFVASELQVCPDAPDWYRLALREGDFVAVSIEFDDARGNLDLAVFEGLPPSGDVPPTWSSEGRGNGESLAFTARQSGDYFVRVASPYVDAQNAYSLAVDVLTDPCADLLERTAGSNDTLATAAMLLGPGPRLYQGLRLCEGDDDWFKASLAPGRAGTLRVRYDGNLGDDIVAEVYGAADDDSPVVVRGRRGILNLAAIAETGNTIYVHLTHGGTGLLEYTMTYADVPESQACIPDGRDNASPETAFEADLGVQEHVGALCPGAMAEVDYFQVAFDVRSTLFADVWHDGGAGAVQLSLLTATGTLLVDGADSAQGAHLESALAAGTYLIAVRGGSASANLSYLLQAYTESSTDAMLCGDDGLERGSANPGASNDTWSNAHEVSDGSWFTNLVLCPGNTDWYTFFAPAGTDLRVTIETHVLTDGAIQARAWGVAGPPADSLSTVVASEGGLLRLDVPWFNVFDGGLQAIEVSSMGQETMHYDVRIDIVD